MISYLIVGTNDLPRAVRYFDALLTAMGASKVYETGTSAGWGWGIGTTMFIVGTPFDKKAATVGNGAMVSFGVDSKEKIDALHAKALALGGSNEGAPGLRGDKIYAAYFRDPDGNKFNFICYL
ncbi:MAG TPA: VOC family protein [Candidatus Acidoferrum sp.]|nr:VOC family protein [Candidatus Acidoferrum sp.]